MTKAQAQATPAKATLQEDNDRVRVTEYRFAPGASTGWHRHEHDYVVVPMTTGPLLIRNAEGETTADLTSGASYFRRAGVEHDVINPGPGEFAFVEIELKKSGG